MANWNVTLTNLENYLVAEMGRSENTVDGYLIDLRQFIKFLDMKNPLSVTPDDIRAFITYLQKNGRTARTRNRKVQSIRTYFRFLRESKIIDSDPSEHIKFAKCGRELPMTLTQKEVDKIIKNINPKDTFAKRDHAMIEMLWSTGMRVAELVSLKKDDINWKDKRIKIKGKGSKDRIIPVNNHALAILRRYIRWERNRFKYGEPVVFLNFLGEPITRQAVWQRLRYHVVGSGVKKEGISPHTFRHSFATALINSGATLKDIQDLLGHEDIISTQIYVHLTKDRLQNAYDKYHPRSKQK